MDEQEQPDFRFDTTVASGGSHFEGLADDGFNEHGVRENDDGSIDVVYRAMEPGIRNGLDVTSEFLDTVASNTREVRDPVIFDHTPTRMNNVGWIAPDADNVWFRDGALGIQFHIPNTGSTVRSDVIADFTHDPPAIQQGSIGFAPDSVEYELPEGYDSMGKWYMDYMLDEHDGNPTLLDAAVQEFSLVTFPGGYDTDTGGLSPAFQRDSQRGKRETGQSRVSTSSRYSLTKHKRYE